MIIVYVILDEESFMAEKKTKELEDVLKNAYVYDFENYQKEYLLDSNMPNLDFFGYMRAVLYENEVPQSKAFLNADIPERYGYKLLSGEKRTRQRDVILRICYGGYFSLEQTQTALKKYGMAPLYAKIARDALLMICFNRRPGSILDVNEVLKEHGMEVLRTSGLQE
jgi:hypothetical protein